MGLDYHFFTAPLYFHLVWVTIAFGRISASRIVHVLYSTHPSQESAGIVCFQVVARFLCTLGVKQAWGVANNVVPRQNHKGNDGRSILGQLKSQVNAARLYFLRIDLCYASADIPNNVMIIKRFFCQGGSPDLVLNPCEHLMDSCVRFAVPTPFSRSQCANHAYLSRIVGIQSLSSFRMPGRLRDHLPVRGTLIVYSYVWFARC